MGFSFSRRKRLGKGTTLNLSKRGASVTRKTGPVSFNSRGKGSIRLGKGIRFKF